MAQLSMLAELMQRMHGGRPQKNRRIFGAKPSYGSRRFKGRNSDAGLNRERTRIFKAMMGNGPYTT